MKKWIFRNLCFCLTFLVVPGATLQAAHYQVGKGSGIECSARARDGVKVKILFGCPKGLIEFDPAVCSKGKFDFKVNTKSMACSDKKLEGELKGNHCFNVEKYPEISFHSDSIIQNPPGGIVYQVYGILNAGGIGKPEKIQITATPVGMGYLFRGTFSMKMSAFGMASTNLGSEILVFFLELRSDQDRTKALLRNM